MESGITLTGKQTEVLLDYLQDYKTYLEEMCCEETDRYTSLIPFISHIEKGIN